MSLRAVIKSKDKKLQKILSEFEAEYKKLSDELQRDVLRLFQSGDFAGLSLDATYSELNGWIQEWLSRHHEAVEFTRAIADEIGAKFVLTQEAIKNYELLQELYLENMSANINLYISDIKRFGIQSLLEGKPLAAIKEGLEERFVTMGRKLTTEVYTGITSADAQLKKDFYKSAGIDKYVYMGPNDDKTRDECQATLNDPRQQTGWTMAQIQSSQTPFIERGGWNCRHEWVAFVEGA